MKQLRREEIGGFVRFCIVGLMNTAVTFVVFTVLRHFDVSTYLSNILSYVAGVTNSFVWNKKWVYKSKESRWIREVLLFVLLFGICYSLQLLVFRFTLKFFPEWLCQICGMGVYSVSNYLLNRIITFNHTKQNSHD